MSPLGYTPLIIITVVVVVIELDQQRVVELLSVFYHLSSAAETYGSGGPLKCRSMSRSNRLSSYGA